MKKHYSLKQRITSGVLALVMVLAYLPLLMLPVTAETVGKFADASTMDYWKKFFGSDVLTTENAGGVWTDKSVFTTADAFAHLVDENGNPRITLENANNFLVALSAIASNKEITGYTNIPTDTILVLDVSGSMNDNQGNNDAVEELVTAANLAIKELTSVNNYNRIGIVLYSGDGSGAGQILLPLGRYTHANDEFLVRTTSGIYNSTEYVAINSGVKDENNQNVTGSKAVSGGTYIQAGIYSAMEMLLDVNDTTIQTGIQAGTKRMPVMVLMSDGAPTYGNNNYAGAVYDRGPNSGQVYWPASNMGDGNTTTDLLGFLTQLTASYAKGRIEKHYDTNALFYTLGFAVGNSGVARSVLDPSKMTSGMTEWWDDYEALEDGGNLVVDGSNRNQKVVTTNDFVQGRYYTDGYYSASNRDSLVSAFANIVNEIKLQSLYLPTNIGVNTSNYGGYIEFVDNIGDFMEIKHIEGVLAGNTLFSGAVLAKNFTDTSTFFGTPENPTEMGNEFVWAVIDRLGLDELYATYEEQRDVARSIINLAFSHGQLSYTSDTNFSNYIGWYADKDGKYLGIWAEDHNAEDVPVNAVYINRSYGMLGSYKDGLRESDLMYMSIQVHTDISTGHSQLIWRIPAALVPLVTYSVTIEGESLDDPGDIKIEIKDAEPIRLIYEVGIRSDINAYNIVDKLGSQNRNADGTYTFYTNQWDLDDYNDPGKFASEDVNTTSHFEPSDENERYYYAENTPVYVKNPGGDYVKYTGSTKPTGTGYYHKEYVFAITNKATGAAEITVRNVEITETTIELAVNDGGEWYIPMGTIKRFDDVSPRAKAANITGTIPNSHTPKIEYHDDSDLTDGSDDSYYYADVVLGNNGKITVEPVTGLSIQKIIDSTITDTDVEYEFVVEAGSSENGAYTYVKLDADGQPIAGTNGVIKFTDGKSDVVKVKANENLVIRDLPVGEYTVAELESAEYAIKTINGSIAVNNYTTVDVVKYTTVEVIFENTLKTFGNVIIEKKVVHPLGSDYVIPESLKFEFVVEILDEHGNPIANREYMTSLSSDPAITDVNGILLIGGHYVKLSADQAITIYNIDNKHIVNVSEVNIPNGFTPTKGIQSVDVSATENKVITFENTYSPASVYPVNIEIKGEKELDGRDWLASDEFTFELQRYDPASAKWITIGQKIVTFGNRTFDFTAEINGEAYSSVGTYHYRVVEMYDPYDAIGGITYDNGPRVFNVIVTDTTMDGMLEIGSVTVSNPTTVVYNANDNVWEINADFLNTYTVRGTSTVTVNINKTVTTTTGVNVSPEGYEFGIFSGDALLGSTVKTDASGKASITLTFGANQCGNTYKYTVKEIHGTADGIVYTNVVYDIEVSVIDGLDGNIKAVIYSATDDDSIPVGAGSVYSASFENQYKPDHTEVSVSGVKTLVGLGLREGDFKFEIYRLEGSNEVYIQTVSNDENGDFVFDNLIFETTGTFTYIVKEVIGSNPGITYDTSSFVVTVTVTANGASLHADVSITKNGAATDEIIFENKYSTLTGENVQVVISGDKKVENMDLAENDFEFILKDSEGNKVQNVKNDKNGKFSFDPLYFYKAGEYTYYVSEIKGTNPGITYDNKEYKVVITVTEDGVGGLVYDVEVSLGTQVGVDIVFTNTYTILDGAQTEVTVSGNKTVSGMNLTAGAFEFALKEQNGTVVQSVFNAANGSFTFNALTFDTVGTYTYTVVEVAGNNPGIAYDKTVYTVTVVVEDNGQGGLKNNVVITKGGQTVGNITFHNVYATTDDAYVSVDIGGIKTLEGKTLTAGAFDFVLKDHNGIVLQTVSNDASGKFNFAPLGFNKAGAYVYTVSEVKGNNPGITYDNTVYNVMIVVEDNGQGGLVYTVTMNNGIGTVSEITFRNVYKILDGAGVTVNMDAAKTLTGMELSAGMFEFVLESKDGTYTESVKNDGEGKIVFTALGFDKAGVYEYTVREISGTNAGITYDSTVYTVVIVVEDDGVGGLKYTKTVTNGINTVAAIEFENTYSVVSGSSVNVPVRATKKISGTTLKANAFRFVLKDQNGTVIETAKNTYAGSVSFSDLKFTKMGVYTYTVSEVLGTNPGVTYDKSVFTLTIEIDDNGDGGLQYTMTIDKSGDVVKEIVFNNSYKTLDDAFVAVDVDATKTLSGMDLTAGKFEFIIESSDGTYSETVTNDANGKITFKTLKFTNVGTYEYTVREIAGTNAGITYDKNVYTVTIAVEDDGVGGLKYTKTVKVGGTEVATIAFANSYAIVDGASVSVPVVAIKTLTGMTLEANAFSFVLRDQSGDIVETVKNDASGKIAFTDLKFTKVGTYTYTVSEVKGTNAGITYDNTVYTVAITVEDNQNGGLAYNVAISDAKGAASEMIFNNTYKISDDASVSVDIEASKTLTGMKLGAGMFGFVIESKDGAYSETVTNDANGKITFKTLKFTNVGTYEYTVREIAGTNAGIRYDRTVYTVTIAVEDDGVGGLKYTKTVKVGGTEVATIAFANSYAIVDGASVSVPVVAIKTLTGMTLEANAFSFVLKDQSGDIVETVKNGASGKIAFTDLKFTKVGTYTYTVSEVKGTNAGITYDNTVYTITVTVADDQNGGLICNVITTNTVGAVDEMVFKNTYKIRDDAFASVNIEGLKTLTGKTLEKDMFEFVLKDENGNVVETVKNNEDGSFSFTEIKLTSVGTYVFTVTESVGDDKRMAYDTAVYVVSVTVSDDNNGGLNKDVVVTKAGKTVEAIEFNNVYTPKPDDITVEIDITKIVENKGTATITPEGFEFILKDLLGIAEDIKVVSDADGKAKIVLTFTENDVGKIFKYTLSEIKGDVVNVTYSTAVYEIEVKIDLGSDNKLTAVLKNNNAAVDALRAEFVNTYTFDIPVTGDESNLMLFMALAVVSGVTLICVAAYAKRRKEMVVD